MCSIDDCDPAEFGHSEQRTARKVHQCVECRRDIAIGERYQRYIYVADGEFGASKICSHCVAAGDWLRKHCGGWLIEMMRDELEEHYADGYRVDGLGRLISGMRRQWRRRRDGALMPIPRVGDGQKRGFV